MDEMHAQPGVIKSIRDCSFGPESGQGYPAIPPDIFSSIVDIKATLIT